MEFIENLVEIDHIVI